MYFEEDSQNPGSIPPAGEQNKWPTEKPKSSGIWKILWGIFTVLSILANVMLLFILLAVIAAFTTTRHSRLFTEDVIQSGLRTNKIVVIDLKGLIDSRKAGEVIEQIRAARNDKTVKALILRVFSPGGMVSSSDQIYREIIKYRTETDKPVVAFMQSVAASGGYYASVACDEIIAEPTVITGSIGVIANYFVFQQLLEEKLGIQPVVVKSGEKKDWPSAFRKPTEEQKQYLQDKIITPVFERFVRIVAQGRDELSTDNVRRLADGSIYNATEALDEKLIDDIGYMDDAINTAAAMAGIEKPHVVEYHKPFSLSRLMNPDSQAAFKIDRKTLYEFSTPQVLYLWNGY